MNHSHYKPVKMLRVEIEPHGVEAAEPSLVQTPKRKESLPSTGALIELSGASQDDFPKQRRPACTFDGCFALSARGRRPKTLYQQRR
jgi:hypothetical protein